MKSVTLVIRSWEIHPELIQLFLSSPSFCGNYTISLTGCFAAAFCFLYFSVIAPLLIYILYNRSEDLLVMIVK